MKRLFTPLLAASLALLASACEKVERIELKPAQLALNEAGQSATLDAQPLTGKGEPVDKEKAKLEFSSSDEKVATVDATGKVTAVKSGTGSITVKSGEVVATAPVQVSIPTTLSVKNAPTTLVLGAGAVLEAEVQDDAGKVVKDSKLAYASADASVVLVEGNTLTAKAPGSTTVTATSGKLKQELPITVKLPDVESVAFVQAVPTTLKVGETASISVAAKSSTGGDIPGVTFTYTSSDEKIATVNAEGLVTAVKPGTATLKAEGGGKSAEAQLTVKKK